MRIKNWRCKMEKLDHIEEAKAWMEEACNEVSQESAALAVLAIGYTLIAIAELLDKMITLGADPGASDCL